MLQFWKHTKLLTQTRVAVTSRKSQRTMLKWPKMDWLGFRGPSEMLTKQFHMDEDLLKALNPDVNWSKTGSEIVASPGRNRKDKVAEKFIIDRSRGRLLVYDERDHLVVAYPATIGSAESDTFGHKVKAAIKEPTYGSNPDVNFQPPSTGTA